MVKHRWKFVGETKYAKVYVDHSFNMTKIETFKYIYYHDGIYPYHNPDYNRKFRRGK